MDRRLKQVLRYKLKAGEFYPDLGEFHSFGETNNSKGEIEPCYFFRKNGRIDRYTGRQVFNALGGLPVDFPGSWKGYFAGLLH